MFYDNNNGQPPEAKMLMLVHELISFIYALGTAFRIDTSDIFFNREDGLSRKNSTMRNIRLARNAPMRPKFLDKKGLEHFFNPDNSLNLDKVVSPQHSGNDDHEIWAYYFDPLFIKTHFIVYPIFGCYGKEDDEEEGFVAVLLITKNPSLFPHFLIFKGTQGGVGLASPLAAWTGKCNNAEWLTNMDRKLKITEFFPGKVHNGFLRVFISVKTQIQQLLEKHRVSGDIYVCGHSLGGALALLTGYWLEATLHFAIKIYSFAQPCVANEKFFLKFDQLMHDKVFSYHVKGDPVKTRLLGSSWRDTQYAVNVDPSGSIVKKYKLREFDCHYMETIIFCLRQFYTKTYVPLLRCYTTELQNFVDKRFIFYDKFVFPYLITGMTYAPEELLYNLEGKFPEHHSRAGDVSIFYGKWNYTLISEKLCQKFMQIEENQMLVEALAEQYPDVKIMLKENNMLMCCIICELYHQAVYPLSGYDKITKTLLNKFHTAFKTTCSYVFLFPNFKTLLHEQLLQSFKKFYEKSIREYYQRWLVTVL